MPVVFTFCCAVLADLCHNRDLATTEECERILQTASWTNCVVNVQCVKDRQTAERTIKLLEQYNKMEEATLLNG